jgi:hypothetical protein
VPLEDLCNTSVSGWKLGHPSRALELDRMLTGTLAGVQSFNAVTWQ